MSMERSVRVWCTSLGEMAMRKVVVLLMLLVAFGFGSLCVMATDAGSYIPEEIQDYCEEIGEMYGVCPELLMAIIETESSGRAWVENGDCKGLMQVSQKWHADRMEKLGVADIFDPYGNILVGTDYLMELAEEHGEISLVLDIYNGNYKAYHNYENGIISKYAGKILDRAEELERINGK